MLLCCACVHKFGVEITMHKNKKNCFVALVLIVPTSSKCQICIVFVHLLKDWFTLPCLVTSIFYLDNYMVGKA
jgi:hypothetical protein